ncbi:MAG: hypothetical protein IKQ03_08225, partial [Prevotella sp.]|nr:hypothetical protein [Prevotella sp.]
MPQMTAPDAASGNTTCHLLTMQAPYATPFLWTDEYGFLLFLYLCSREQRQGKHEEPKPKHAMDVPDARECHSVPRRLWAAGAGPSYSKSGHFRTNLSLKWGASPHHQEMIDNDFLREW